MASISLNNNNPMIHGMIIVMIIIKISTNQLIFIFFPSRLSSVVKVHLFFLFCFLSWSSRCACACAYMQTYSNTKTEQLIYVSHQFNQLHWILLLNAMMNIKRQIHTILISRLIRSDSNFFSQPQMFNSQIIASC